MASNISTLDYAVWVTTLVAELATSFVLRRHQTSPALRAVKLYLVIQASTLSSMYFVYSFAPANVSYWAYIAVSLLGDAAELSIIAGIYQELRGRVQVWGSIKVWIVLTAILSCIIACLGSVGANQSLPFKLAMIHSLRQSAGFIRISALLLVTLYGFLMASAWGRAASMVWGGLAMFVATEFTCSQFSLLHPSWEKCLRHFPDAIFFVSLILWSASASRRVVSSELEKEAGTNDAGSLLGVEA